MEYRTLIEAEALAALLEDARRTVAPVIVDARFDLADPQAGRRAYAAAHLPGAHFADLDADLSGPVTAETGRHPLPDPAALAARLAAFGLGGDTQLVVYDGGSGAFAARLWWLARWLGHRRVAVLDGGFARWQALGLPLTDAPTPTPPRGDFQPRPDDDMWLSTDAVRERLADGSLVLLDARAAPRFEGRVEPIDPVAGHVPGARNLPFERNLDASGTFRSPAELAALYSAALGDHSPEEMAAMCGSGVTACHLLLGLQHAGLPGGRLYAGSWSEWIRDPSRPVARDHD